MHRTEDKGHGMGKVEPLQPALEEDILWSPSQRTFTESSFQCLLHRAYKRKLHGRTDLDGHIVLHILPIRPRKYNLRDTCPVRTENLLFDATDRTDAATKRNLSIRIDQYTEKCPNMSGMTYLAGHRDVTRNTGTGQKRHKRTGL